VVVPEGRRGVKSVLEAVLDHAQRRPDALCSRLLSGRAGAGQTLATRTWREVAEAAARAARFLAEQGVKRGDVVILMGTHHPDFHACWLGCVWLGAVPSVLAEPSVRVDREVYWGRLKALFDRIDARVFLADPTIAVDEALLARSRRTYVEAVAEGPGADPPQEPAPDDLLLLQHSSGTTGLHKGVMLSHGAVMRHAAAYREALALGGDEIFASWLPLYHDMGLIACFVTPLIEGLTLIWMSPFEWVANPALLLHAIHGHRATHVWLPNFAFSFLAQRTREARGAFDLSCLKAAVNCSEPVTVEAMDAFAARFADDRLSPGALQPCYAMAETVFGVATATGSEGSRRRRVLRSTWHDEHAARIAPDGTPDDQTVVHASNGRPLSGCEVKIGGLDGGAQALGPAQAGRVLVKAPFLFDGYYRRPDLNADLFVDGYFDTGDLGYLDEAGNLHVTGRHQAVHRMGYTLYPESIQRQAAECGAPVCVIGVADERRGSRLVLFVEDPARREVAYWRRRIDPLLAAYERPDVIEVWPKLPIGRSGKVDRARLTHSLTRREDT
jgi:acyl-CoA synthetase (AMP-forming)/AMP-acid ligase II